MCLTDLFRIPNKKSFKKCPSFGKKKKSRKLSRTSSTAPILRSSILKSTYNIYTLASLNSLRNTTTTATDSDGTDYTKSSTEYESFEDSKQLQIHLPQRSTRNGIDSVARTPLLEAAVAGQLSAIQWFLKHTCCTLNEKDADGCNILHLAANSIAICFPSSEGDPKFINDTNEMLAKIGKSNVKRSEPPNVPVIKFLKKLDCNSDPNFDSENADSSEFMDSCDFDNWEINEKTGKKKPTTKTKITRETTTTTRISYVNKEESKGKSDIQPIIGPESSERDVDNKSFEKSGEKSAKTGNNKSAKTNDKKSLETNYDEDEEFETDATDTWKRKNSWNENDQKDEDSDNTGIFIRILLMLILMMQNAFIFVLYLFYRSMKKTAKNCERK